MNIFYVDKDPVIAALSLCDKHVVKMILESAQILCTVHRLNGDNTPELYKATHINHPCTKWVKEHENHYHWLFDHFFGLIQEYNIRYNKVHKCTGLVKILRPVATINDFYWVDPPQCMPDKYKGPDTVDAYRNYYNKGKHHLHKWTNRKPPEWITSVAA